MTDANQAIVWSAYYKPFGAATVTVSTITNNLRFPGQYFDAETGLNYNYYRDYNPVIGRYIESDPLNIGSIQILLPSAAKELVNFYTTIPGRQILFAYVRNNPINRKDPYGLYSAADLLPDSSDIYQRLNPHPGPLPPDDPYTPDSGYRIAIKKVCVKWCSPEPAPCHGPPPKGECCEWKYVAYLWSD